MSPAGAPGPNHGPPPAAGAVDLRQPLLDGLPAPVPAGASLPLDGRGTTFVRTMAGPAGRTSPPLLLLHGLTASAAINWVHAFGPLAERAPVVAPDLRGHARGLPAPRRFELALMADDAVATLDALGVRRPVIAVGFSMGGAVAQQLAHDHPDRVAGLVLASTAMRFSMAPIGKRLYATNAVLARGASALPGGLEGRLVERAVRSDHPGVRRLLVQESARHSPAGQVRAAQALSRFRSSDWLERVEVPAAVVVTTRDRSLRPAVQRALAERLPAAELVEADAGHAGVVFEPSAAVPPIVEAVDRVIARL